MSVSCACCVLGRGLCVGMITCREESCRVNMCMSVIVKPRQWGDPDPLGPAAIPWKKKSTVRNPSWERVFHLINKLPTFYRSLRFIVLTQACNLCLSWAKWNHSTLTHCIWLRYVLILSPLYKTGLCILFLFSSFPTRILQSHDDCLLR